MVYYRLAARRRVRLRRTAVRRRAAGRTIAMRLPPAARRRAPERRYLMRLCGIVKQMVTFWEQRVLFMKLLTLDSVVSLMISQLDDTIKKTRGIQLKFSEVQLERISTDCQM